MRLLSIVLLASFLGSATLADAQVFKPRGKGSKSAKSSTAKKSASAKQSTAAKRSGKTPAKKATKATKAKAKKPAGRPADLTPDPDEDYVVIEDLEDDE